MRFSRFVARQACHEGLACALGEPAQAGVAEVGKRDELGLGDASLRLFAEFGIVAQGLIARRETLCPRLLLPYSSQSTDL
jgi:hypothetical protein